MSYRSVFLKDHNIDRPHLYEKQDKPLKSLDEFLSWPGTSFDGPSQKWTPSPLCPRANISSSTKQREVIYCHDFKGGYLDDAACFGNSNLAAFRFYHWHLISIFQYFSHELVSIPPVAWIDVAHKNGVRVHGTFLTEHWQTVGQNAFNEIFLSRKMSIFAAKKLHEIQHHYGFEGWFINLESKVHEDISSVVTDNICLFLKTLRDHGSEVVWYDAITVKGGLNWQNALNANNLPFFEAAGHIFLNYTWKAHHLAETRQFAATEERAKRVFVGVDCFGRGTIGGGGFNTDKALQAIMAGEKDGALPLSIAMFAPGWTHEHNESTFWESNLRFWSLLKPYLPDWGTALPLPKNSAAKIQPLVSTSFCLGQGHWTRLEGLLDSRGDWNFLAVQQTFPTALVTEFREDSQSASESTATGVAVNVPAFKIVPSMAECFTGGSSLCVWMRASAHLSLEMFRWNVQQPRGTPHFRLVFKLKCQDEGVPCSEKYLKGLNLVLRWGNGDLEVVDLIPLAVRKESFEETDSSRLWYECNWNKQTAIDDMKGNFSVHLDCHAAGSGIALLNEFNWLQLFFGHFSCWLEL